MGDVLGDPHAVRPHAGGAACLLHEHQCLGGHSLCADGLYIDRYGGECPRGDQPQGSAAEPGGEQRGVPEASKAHRDRVRILWRRVKGEIGGGAEKDQFRAGVREGNVRQAGGEQPDVQGGVHAEGEQRKVQERVRPYELAVKA